MGIDVYERRGQDARDASPPAHEAAAAGAKAGTAGGAAAPPAPPGTAPAAPPAPGVEAPDTVKALRALASQVSRCEACELCRTRTQTVFGVGDPSARVMFIGEGPGAEEDRRGEPFVGRAGKLLDAMLRAMGTPRETVYIANIVKCRPPNNRDPRPEEVQACSAYLTRQVELVAPEVIVAVGRVAAQRLLRSEAPLGKLRAASHTHTVGPGAASADANGGGGGGGSGSGRTVPVVVTYHPAYLLRSPQEKRKSWEDLKRVLGLLERSRPAGTPAAET